MQLVNEWFVGWLETNVKEIVKSDIEILQGLSFVLVTSIDSTRKLSSALIGQKLKQRYPDCKFLGDGILLPRKLLSDADVSLGLFYGFDELWFFDSEPSQERPKEASLVGPFNIESEKLRPAIENWMKQSNCRLGLGDGIGLNYITPDQNIARVLELRSI